MGRVILFSPVGGTDPISNTNCQDGALLHICRVYKPDVIYMYMSKYVLDCEAEDHRYTYCLGKLYDVLGKELDYSIIDRPALNEVQDFDFFYDDYKTEINRIMLSLNEDDELLLNTSSGTPAMKSALVVLATLGDINGKLIQVTTPEKAINKHDHDNYDVKTLWELNPDNDDGFVNRCKPIECPSIVRLKNEEMIKKLILSYDYSAALSVAEMINDEYTKSYIHLLKYACLRMQLSFRDLTIIEKEHGMDSLLPVQTSKYRNAVEYALVLFTKPQRGDYADFARALTPLILELFLLIVEKYTGINAREEYCSKDEFSGGYRWNTEKLRQNKTTSEWIEIWSEAYKQEFKSGGYLQSVHLLFVIRKKCPQAVISKADLLRVVEENFRNSAAHEIGTVTADTVKKMTGYSCDKIIDTVKTLFNYSGVVVTDEMWVSYDTMNSLIFDHMNSTVE